MVLFSVCSLSVFTDCYRTAHSLFAKIYSCAIFLLWFVLATVCTAASRKGSLEGVEGQPVYRFFSCVIASRDAQAAA